MNDNDDDGKNFIRSIPYVNRQANRQRDVFGKILLLNEDELL